MGRALTVSFGSGPQATLLCLLLALATSCMTQPAPKNACQRARQTLWTCGLSAPYLETEDCEGPLLLIAHCVNERANVPDRASGAPVISCDALSQIRSDDCLRDLGNPNQPFPVALIGSSNTRDAGSNRGIP